MKFIALIVEKKELTRFTREKNGLQKFYVKLMEKLVKLKLTSSSPDIVERHCAIFDTNVDVVGEL